MRVLGIETSSRRGSVALVENDRLVARATHVELNAHAERLGPMLDQALAQAGWQKSSLDRVGVGMGPGSFTGVRVGIAFAQGISLGLGIPLCGVGSLETMVRSARHLASGLTMVPVLDARRGEVFAAAYASDGRELREPYALTREDALAELRTAFGQAALLLGEIVRELGATPPDDELCALPDAVGAALLAAERDPAQGVREPIYVRDSGATPQALPPSPFGS